MQIRNLVAFLVCLVTEGQGIDECHMKIKLLSLSTATCSTSGKKKAKQLGRSDCGHVSRVVFVFCHVTQTMS